MVSQRKKCFIIEGNIGAGKSTFLQIVKNCFSVDTILEPHEKWQQVDGQYNLLECFYNDTQRWAYTFQSYAFITRIMAQEEDFKKNPDGIQILERSVYSDRYCFAKNAYENDNMSSLEWKLYREWFSWLVDNYTVKPDGFIYLQTEPEICYERLTKRNRLEEIGVSLSYLKQLHEKHEGWLINKEGLESYLVETPVLILPCNQDFEHNLKEQQKHLAKMSEFIGTTFCSPVDNNVISTVSL